MEVGFTRKPRVYELENPRFTSVNLGFASDNLGFTNANPGLTIANPRLTDLMCKST